MLPKQKMLWCILLRDETIWHCAETQMRGVLELQPCYESTSTDAMGTSEPGHKGEPLKASAGFHVVMDRKAVWGLHGFRTGQSSGRLLGLQWLSVQ